MKFKVPSLSEDISITVNEFTLDDFRNIAFLIENNEDFELYKFLESKIDTDCNAFDKFYALLHARIKFVNESITLNNGSSNINININVWDDILKQNYKDISTTIEYDNFKITLNYPEHLIYETYEDIIMDCISYIEYNGNVFKFRGVDRDGKNKILEKLPTSLTTKVYDYVLSVFESKVLLMESKLNLPEVTINVFDNTAFDLLKVLYNYYTYDDIIELLFMLSRRINDISYLNSRNPKDLDFLIKLYYEDVEKTNQEDKLTI